MPRSLQPDRQLFGVTLALCFIGAVMVFSASAVTAGPADRQRLHVSAAAGSVDRASESQGCSG